MSDPGELMRRPGADRTFRRVRGAFVPESLVPACQELEAAFASAWADAGFPGRLDGLLRGLRGPTDPGHRVPPAERALGVRLLLKREDLAHTGSHKLNNVLGQALLAERMGKHRLIAETGAGQHGVATATAAALFGLECVVYMGAVDIERQELNVFRMELLGAEVRPVDSGSRTLKDAINEALRDWVASVETTHYCIGSVMGPHPFPISSVSSSGSSATRPGPSAASCSTGPTPTWWWPVSEVARTRPALSRASSTHAPASSASRRPAGRR